MGVKAGTYYRVPLEDAIFEAKKYLKIEDTMDDDFLEILAWNAVRHIMPLSNVMFDVQKLPVCGGVVQLPKNVLRFLWFRICEPKTSENVPTTFSRSFFYADLPFLKNCGCDSDESVKNGLNVVSVRDGKLVFRNNGNIYFDHIEIAFVGYVVDENGVFTVTDIVKQAVVYRICSEYSTVNSQKYDNFQKQVWMSKATAMMNKVKGDDFYENFKQNIDQVQGIARAMNYPLTLSRSRARY
jgi:hypothetical protein